MSSKKKGFTLVELLAVIVILAVISLIAVPIILNIIENVKREAFRDSVLNVYKTIEKYQFQQNIDGKEEQEEYTVQELKRAGLFKGNIEDGKFYKDKDGDMYAYQVTNGEYCAQGKINELIIEKDCVKLDKTPAKIDETKIVTESTTNSITIIIAKDYAEDKDSGIKEYELILTLEGKEIERKLISYKKEDLKHTFEKLKNNTEYTLQVITRNNNDVETKLKEKIKIKTEEFSQIEYEVDPEGWSKSKTITIIGETKGAQLQYQIDTTDDDKWIDITSKTKIELTKNSVIYSRLYDGTNISSAAVLEITKIAQKPVCDLEVDSYTLNNVSITTNCTTSVGIKEYEYSIDNSKNVTTSNKHTFNSIHISTLKVKITDNVNNEIILELTEEQKEVVYNGIYELLDKRITLLENNTFLHQYPVGSIYITTSSAENTASKVATKYGGTWEAYGTDRVLRGTTGTSGTTGGTSTVTLATTNLPSHTHSVPAASGTTGSTGSGYTISHGSSARTTSVPNVSETVTGYHYSGGRQNYGVAADGYVGYIRPSSNKSEYAATSAYITKTHTHTMSDRYLSSMSGVASHNHTVQAGSKTTGANGSGTAFSIIDSYITVYMYKRTS